MSKTRAAARTWGFWMGISIAGLGAIQTGLEQFNAAIPPLYYAITNIVVGTIVAMLRVAAAVPLESDDGQDSGV